MGFTKVILSIFSRQIIEQPSCFKKIKDSKVDKTKNIYFRFENSTQDIDISKKVDKVPENKRIGF